MVLGRKSVQRLDEPDEISSPMDGDPSTGHESNSESISLEDLGNAFAAVMHQSAMGLSDPVAVDGLSAANQRNSSPSAEHVETYDGVPVTPNSILEALLFVGTRTGEPIPTTALVRVLKDFSEAEIEGFIGELNARYAKRGRPLTIEAQEGGYAMRLAVGLESLHDAFQGSVRETQLTQNSIDCLALVAYQPGITKQALEQQWGQPVGSVLAYLIRKDLLRVALSRPTAAGPEDSSDQKCYFTTDRFLEILGLESLEDLPRGDEL